MGKLKELGEFLTDIAPALINFGRSLFRRHRGDSVAAKRDIKSRTAEIDAMWKRHEEALGRKHGRG